MTGVQTCALPISGLDRKPREGNCDSRAKSSRDTEFRNDRSKLGSLPEADEWEFHDWPEAEIPCDFDSVQ